MALRDAQMPSLLDVANRTGPRGMAAKFAEFLQNDNPILLDMPFIECNRDFRHETGVRTGLPKANRNMIGYGARPSPMVFNTGMVECFPEVSADLIELGNKTADNRLSEEIWDIEAMNQEVAETIFNGDEAKSPAPFTGLSHYYNDLSADNATQIIDAKGTGSNLRSIWIVTWGDSTCHGIYPKGIPAGLQMKDLGRRLSTTQPVRGGGPNDGMKIVYRSHYQWYLGLVLWDWRFLVRIANIDIDEITDAAASGPNLVQLITNGLRRLKNMSRGLVAMYTGREILEAINIQHIEAKENSTLTYKQLYGEGVFNLTCGGVPLHMTEALELPESRVT